MQIPNIYTAHSYRDAIKPAVSQHAAQGSSDIAAMLKKLREAHPELNIQNADLSEAESLKNAILTSRGIYNVVIDDALLKQLCEDENLYSKYDAILGGIARKQELLKNQKEMTGNRVTSVTTIIDKEGKTSNYTVSQRPKREVPPLVTDTHREDSVLNRYQNSEKKNKFTINYKFNYGGHMARLAQAKSVQNVRGVIQSQYAEIGRAKRLIEDRNTAAVTVRRIRGVISKANLKISRLHKEELLDLRRMAAEKKAKAQLARELTEELKAKKTARRGQERCDTVDQLGVLQSANPNRCSYEDVLKAYQINGALFSDAAAASGAVAGNVPSVGLTGADAAGAATPEISVDISI